MSRSGSMPDPERLVDGKLGPLLKEANREFAAGLDQPAAFHRVNQRLSTTSRRLSRSRSAWWLVPA